LLLFNFSIPVLYRSSDITTGGDNSCTEFQGSQICEFLVEDLRLFYSFFYLIH